MWFPDYLKSSIGKKQTMGVAGLGLVGFLAGHLLGNLQLLNLDAAAAPVWITPSSRSLPTPRGSWLPFPAPWSRTWAVSWSS